VRPLRRPHVTIFLNFFPLNHGHQRFDSQTFRIGYDSCLSNPPYISALLCADVMAFSFPRQLCAMGDSDEEMEMQLMSEVALLDEQLKSAGRPCDNKIYAHLFQDLNAKPVCKRVKLWRWRLELTQKLVDAMLSRSSAPSASSGETAATSSPVIKLEPDCKRKFEEAKEEAKKKKRKFGYIELPGGSAPLMSPIHVAFAAKSVALLRKQPGMIGPELIAEWNKDHAEEWNKDHANSLPKKGRGASGKADNFFNNGHLRMPIRRVHLGPLAIIVVLNQLTVNGTPIRFEPTKQITRSNVIMCS
jgi:hypothetical protein